MSDLLTRFSVAIELKSAAQALRMLGRIRDSDKSQETATAKLRLVLKLGAFADPEFEEFRRRIWLPENPVAQGHQMPDRMDALGTAAARAVDWLVGLKKLPQSIGGRSDMWFPGAYASLANLIVQEAKRIEAADASLSHAYQQQKNREYEASFQEWRLRKGSQEVAERANDPAWQLLYADPEYQQAVRDLQSLNLSPIETGKNPDAVQIHYRILRLKESYGVDSRSADERAETPEHFIQWLDGNAYSLWSTNGSAQFLNEVLGKAVTLARRASLSPPPEPPAGRAVTQEQGQSYLLKLAEWAKQSIPKRDDALKSVTPRVNTLAPAGDCKRPDWQPIGESLAVFRFEPGESRYKIPNQIIKDYAVPCETVGNGKGVRWIKVGPWVNALRTAGRLVHQEDQGDVVEATAPAISSSRNQNRPNAGQPSAEEIITLNRKNAILKVRGRRVP